MSTNPSTSAAENGAPSPDDQTLGSSVTYQLFSEFIKLREFNNREHRTFERQVTKISDDLQRSFNSFAADTQRAYQQLRQEMHGEKRVGLALLNELLELSMDLDGIVGSKPALTDQTALQRWMEAVEIEARKVQASLTRLGIHQYDAVISSPYNPALHERVGSKRVEGMGPLLVAEQRERGYASQQPEFVLRRPKVIVSE